MMQIKKWYVVLAGLLLSVLIWVVMHFNVTSYMTFDWLKEQALYLQHMTKSHYVIVLMCYMIIFILATVCFIPITVLMTILGGFLFGGVNGALYASLSAMIGGSILFLLVRHFFADIVRQRYAYKFKRFRYMLQMHGARYLLCLQISPITPTFFINLFMGLTRVPFWTYVWTSFIGMLPGSFIYALAGQKLQLITTMEDVMPPWIFFILMLLSFFGLVPVIFKHYGNEVEDTDPTDL